MQQETQKLLESLTQAGFWSLEDEGDPMRDDKALGKLLNRVEGRFAKNARYFVNSPSVGQLYFEMRLICAGSKHSLATGTTLAETICNAALALPRFLKEHPECGD